ncbi:outer membrane beta-barrel protein [Rhodobacterales bacterium HKCCE3408]|nr:outer membrane beta-barrel protein [Rhodobacterales bacterium HKCCE3408]
MTFMIRTLAATATIAVLTATAASAGGAGPAAPDPVVVAPAAPAAAAVGAFDGAYVGLSYGIVRGDGEETIAGTFGRPLEDGDAFGGIAGYNVQRGNFVFGGELRVLAFDGYEEALAGIPLGSIDRVTDVRGRAGYVFGDVMLYGAAGWSWATFDNVAAGTEADLDGYNLGLGVEYNINENFFVGLDYTARTLDGEAGVSSFEFDTNTATISAGFRF